MHRYWYTRAEQYHYRTALQLTLERNKCWAVQIKQRLRKIKRSTLFSSFHPQMLEEFQNYTEGSQGVRHKTRYLQNTLSSPTAHETGTQVCHRNDPSAVLSLWLDCQDLRAFPQSMDFQVCSLELSPCCFPFPGVAGPKSVIAWKWIFLPEGKVNPPCLTWTLQDSRGTFLVSHNSSEGWLENSQS